MKIKRTRLKSQLLCILILVSLPSGCIGNDNESGQFSANQTGPFNGQNENITLISVTDIEEHTITRISVRNGLSGESGTINDTDMIKTLIADIDSYCLEEKSELEDLNGYWYFIDFYSGSNRVSRINIIDDGSVQVNGVYYDVIGSSINTTEFEELILSSGLKPDGKGLNVKVSGITEVLSFENLTSQSKIILTGTVHGAFPSKWNTLDGQKPDKPDEELNIGAEALNRVRKFFFS